MIWSSCGWRSVAATRGEQTWILRAILQFLSPLTSSLSSLGEAQAKAMAKDLAPELASSERRIHIYASCMQRAIGTAAALYKRCKELAPTRIDPKLHIRFVTFTNETLTWDSSKICELPHRPGRICSKLRAFMLQRLPLEVISSRFWVLLKTALN